MEDGKKRVDAFLNMLQGISKDLDTNTGDSGETEWFEINKEDKSWSKMSKLKESIFNEEKQAITSDLKDVIIRLEFLEDKIPQSKEALDGLFKDINFLKTQDINENILDVSTRELIMTIHNKVDRLEELGLISNNRKNK